MTDDCRAQLYFPDDSDIKLCPQPKMAGFIFANISASFFYGGLDKKH